MAVFKRKPQKYLWYIFKETYKDGKTSLKKLNGYYSLSNSKYAYSDFVDFEAPKLGDGYYTIVRAKLDSKGKEVKFGTYIGK